MNPTDPTIPPPRRYLIPGLILTLIILLYFGPQALRGRSLGEGEGVTYYLPMRVQVAEAFQRGEWPFWNPYAFGGMPLLADCQAGTFYPFNLLYLLLEPITAMNVVMLTGHILAAWGMIVLLRRHRVSPWAAGFGAAVFVFSGFMIAHMGHVTIVNAAIWLPWLVWALHGWCETRHRPYLAALMVFWVFQIFAGHPQIVVYSGIILGMLLIGWTWRDLGYARRWTTWAGIGAAGVVAVLICSVQLVPTMDLSTATGRNFQPTLSLFENYRFPIQYTPVLWLPYLFGTQADTPLGWYWWGDWNFVELAGYVGLIPWMVLPAAMFLPAARARGARLWAVIALIHLVLAWNTDTPLGYLLFKIPIYNSFEAAGRHLLGLILGLAMCAGLGLDALVGSSRLRARRWAKRGAWLIVALVLAIVVGVFWGYEYAVVHLHYGLHMTEGRPRFEHRPWMMNPWMVAVPVVLAGMSAWALIRFAGKRDRRASVLLTSIFLIDILSAGYLCAWRWRHEGNYQVTPPDAELARLLAPDEPGAPPPRFLLFGPWPLNYAVCPQGNMLYDFASLNGYGPFQLKRFHTMLGEAVHHDGQTHDESLLHPSVALDLWSCRYVILTNAQGVSVPEALNDPQRYRRVLTTDDLRVYENLNALPFARWVHTFHEVGSDEKVVDAIRTGRLPAGTSWTRKGISLITADTDIELDTIPTTLPMESGTLSNTKGITWLHNSPNRMKLHLTTDRPRRLVLAVHHLEGWAAILDDQTPTPIHRVDYALSAVNIPPGNHTLHLRYRPPSWNRSLILSTLGLTLAFPVLLIFRKPAPAAH